MPGVLSTFYLQAVSADVYVTKMHKEVSRLGAGGETPKFVEVQKKKKKPFRGKRGFRILTDLG